MQQKLSLLSFTVEGYRGIRLLELPTLERVNLFVGLNNAGKTSLLEAIHLYASRTPRTVLASILRERSGFRPRFSSASDRDVTSEQITVAVESVRSLFYGTFAGKIGDSIRLTAKDADLLTISLPWATSAPLDDQGNPVDLELFLEPDSPLIQMERGGETMVLSLDWFLRRFGVMLTGVAQRTIFIPAQGLGSAKLGELWNQAASAGHAEAIEEALRAIVPDLERIYLLGEPANGGRSLAMQLRDSRRPVPLSSMGDGTNRVFGLALACVRAKGGVLLIDEVENGLHHTIHNEVWSSLFTLAERLNVQVFATTHSWEAVVGFQDAARRSVTTGLLYRLEREADGRIYAERYTEEEVAIAAEQQVEVR
jgi:predicted ATPase